MYIYICMSVYLFMYVCMYIYIYSGSQRDWSISFFIVGVLNMVLGR